MRYQAARASAPLRRPWASDRSVRSLSSTPPLDADRYQIASTPLACLVSERFEAASECAYSGGVLAAILEAGQFLEQRGHFGVGVSDEQRLGEAARPGIICTPPLRCRRRASTRLGRRAGGFGGCAECFDGCRLGDRVGRWSLPDCHYAASSPASSWISALALGLVHSTTPSPSPTTSRYAFRS